MATSLREKTEILLQRIESAQDNDSGPDKRENERAQRDRISQFHCSIGRGRIVKTFEEFKVSNSGHQRILDGCLEWCRDIPARLAAGEGLVFFGPVGVGKDHLALASAEKCLPYASVIFANGRDLVAGLRGSLEREGDRQFMGQYKAPMVLVLSDPLPVFGGLNAWQADAFYSLFEARNTPGKINIVTINVANDQEADERLGAATWDRICDRSWKLHCNWESHRQPARVFK